LPVVAARAQRELEHTERGGIADFTVGMRRAERPMILPTGARNEFSDSALRIGGSVRSLRGKTLVVMIVAADDDVRIGVIKRLPDGLDFQIVAVRAAGAE